MTRSASKYLSLCIYRVNKSFQFLQDQSIHRDLSIDGETRSVWACELDCINGEKLGFALLGYSAQYDPRWMKMTKGSFFYQNTQYLCSSGNSYHQKNNG